VDPDQPGNGLHRLEGRRLFGLNAAGYRAGRPDYPEAVYETLAGRCELGPRTRVLEIGPGTGLVTQRLLRTGAHVTALEPDPSMSTYLVDTMASARLDVIPSSLEAADIAEAGFDLAVAATSFHWVDQEAGLYKLGQALRPGGWAALWWTLFRDPDQPDEFSQAVEEVLGPTTRGAFDEPGRPPFQLDQAHRQRDLTRWAGLLTSRAR
jgi:SAM-dependent methyltransferase